MNTLIRTVNQANFSSQVLESQQPVLVDFWAEWCAPCRVQNPILDELVKEWQDQVVIAKVNVDDNPDLAEQFNITSIPTINIFKNGQVIHQFVGVQSKDQIMGAFRELNLTMTSSVQ